MMNPGIINSCELKPRNMKLVPSKCVAIGLKRNISPVISTFSSSLSMLSNDRMISDNHTTDYRNRHIVGTTATNLTKGTNNSQQSQSSLLDKVSMTSTTSSTTTENRECLCQRPINCVELFNELIKENICLSFTANGNSSCSKINLAGFIYPGTLIVTSGQQDTLETLCSLWSKRILKAPPGYMINFVGYMTTVFEVATISQSHFTPLTEALYRCIDELNTMRINANLETIIKRLCSEFPSMELPCEDILRNTLHTMTSENKLNYDSQKQVYTTVHHNFLLPWGMDGFENLSISDRTISRNYKNNDSELEFKNFPNTQSQQQDNRNHLFRNGYSNFEELVFPKSKSLSTKSSVITDDDFSDGIAINKKLILLRNSSLYNNETMNNSKRINNSKTSFRRSKSFRLNHKPNPNNENNDNKVLVVDRKCTCSTDMIIKRQSLLGKLFKLNSYSKGRSSTIIPSSNQFLRSVDFGSQFPEGKSDNTKNTIVMYNDQPESNKKEFSSKGTQTVKSGPEEIITVVMRQIGKHALSRKRYCGSKEESCCYVSQWPHNKKCCEQNVSKIQRDKKHKHKHHHNSSQNGTNFCNECHKCNHGSNGVTPPLDLIQRNVSRNHDMAKSYRKRNTSSLRHHPQHHNNYRSNRNNLTDYIDNNNFCQHDSDGIVNSTDVKLFSRKKGGLFCHHKVGSHIDCTDLHNNLDDKYLELFNLDEKITSTMPYNLKNEFYPNTKINECTDDGEAGDCEEDQDDDDDANNDSIKRTSLQEMSTVHSSNKHHHEHDRLSFDNGHQSHGNLLINNSLSVKIEIETSNISPNIIKHHNSLDLMNNKQKTLEPTIHKVVNNVGHLLQHESGNQQRQLNNYFDESDMVTAIYTNGTYSQFDFGDNHHNSPMITSNDHHHNGPNVFEYRNGNNCKTFGYPPELNYANSITALKEQIARAKANFFKESFAS